MAIYFFGTEDIDFPGSSFPSTQTTAGFYRSHLRSSIYLAVHQTAFMQSTTFAVGEITSGWLSFYVYTPIVISHIDGWIYAGFCKSGGNKGIYVGNDSGYALIYHYDGTTKTLLATSDDAVFPESTIRRVDLQIQSYGASATVNVYVNGSLAVSYSGDISISGVTGFDRVGICGVRNYSVSWLSMYYSEIIVADQDTRSLSVVNLYPTAVGSTNSWTGPYTNVDEAANSDLDFIYTNTASTTFQCNLYNQTAFTLSRVLK